MILKNSINQSVNGSNNSFSKFTVTKTQNTTIYTLIYWHFGKFLDSKPVIIHILSFILFLIMF